MPKGNSNALIDLRLNYSVFCFFLHSWYESISLPETLVNEIDLKTSNTKLIISNEAPCSRKYHTASMLYLHKNLNSSEMDVMMPRDRIKICSRFLSLEWGGVMSSWWLLGRSFLLKFQDVEIDKDPVKQRETWLEHLNNLAEVSQSTLSSLDRVQKQLRGLVALEFFYHSATTFPQSILNSVPDLAMNLSFVFFRCF